MAKQRRWLLRLLLVVVVLVAAAIALAPFVPLSPLKPAVESRLSTTLGRTVSVGSLRLSLLGGPYVLINDMTAKEDPAFGDGNFMVAKEVRANIALTPLLLRRQVVIEGLTIKSPDLTFVKNESGAWSWTTLGQSAANSARLTKEPPAFASFLALIAQAQTATAINDLHIESASVRLLDASSSQSPESLYKNVYLHASGDKTSATSSRFKGEFRAESSEEEGAQLLRARMPFDLTVDRSQSPRLSAQGSLGPGDLQTRNFEAQGFRSLVNFNGGAVTLDQMEMSLYEGAMRGRMELNLSNQQFTTEGQVENLNIDQALGSKLQMQGQITGHINAEFKLGGRMLDFQRSVPTISGQGRMSSGDLFVASFNVSENVARALKLDQIGDMASGTKIGRIESQFHIDQGVVTTSNLNITQMDGLGDATANQGWFKIESSPTLNYAATIVLNSDATARVKSASTLIGIAVSILERNNSVAVPVNITGEVRNPQVQVDISRLF